MENILTYFEKYLPLDDIDKKALISRLSERRIKRKQYILQEGDTCKHFSYVVEGCFKTYGVDNEIRKHDKQLNRIGKKCRLSASQMHLT